MKKLLPKLLIGVLAFAAGAYLSIAGVAQGAAFLVASGGTGSTTLNVNQILEGNGTSPIGSNTATGTSPFGINVLSGCFAVNGVCLGGTGTVTSITGATPNATLTIGGTNPITTSGTMNFDLNLGHSNIWTVLQQFNGGASGTVASFNGPLYVGTTATTTIQGTATSSFGAGISATIGNFTSSSASSTFANGVDLSAGCFSITGTCLQTIISSASAYKQAVRYASTSTLPANTYNNGVGGVGATLTAVGNVALFIDGNTPSVGDRVLVKNEATGANNGIYTVTTVGVSGVTAYVLTRAIDYNTSADVFPGVASFTNSGTVNANTCWILTNTTAITIGTTALTYDDACGAGSFTATAPINLSGTTFSLNIGGGLDTAGTNLAAQVSTGTVPTQGQIAYWGPVGTPSPLYSVATSTLTAGTGLTGSFTVVGSGGSVALSTPVSVANGGTNNTALTFGNLWFDGTKIAATSSIFTVGSIIGTTTATSTFAGGITQNSIPIQAYKTPGLTYSTTTAWTGTTTIPLPSPFINDKLDAAQCYTDIGTLNVQIGSWTASTTMFNASTTQGTESFSSNNTFNAGAKWYIDIGTPASSPAKITCTFKKENTAF